MRELFDSLWQSVVDKPLNTAIEFALIGVVVYAVLRFLHGTRGARLLQGLIIVLIGGFLVVKVGAERAGLDRITELYQPFAWFVIMATLLAFQPELRRGLMRLGETRLRRGHRSEIDAVAKPITISSHWLSKNKIGGLIAIEGHIGLSGLIDQGVRLDAKLTPELLNTIFWPGSALHDLGVVIQQGRISAAGVPFPLGDTDEHDRSVGSRHRAAIGLSMESDAIIIVVSEETGSISIAERGRLYSHIPANAVFKTLRRHMSRQHRTSLPPDDETTALLGGDDSKWSDPISSVSTKHAEASDSEDDSKEETAKATL